MFLGVREESSVASAYSVLTADVCASVGRAALDFDKGSNRSWKGVSEALGI